MKRGPFPMWPAFPSPEYYDPLRLPLGRPHHFPGSPVIGRASLPATPQATGPRRLSRVPRTTVRTFNAQYAGGFLSARSWIPDAFRGLRRRVTGSAPSIPRPQTGSLDDACSGFTHVADRAVAPPRFAPGLSTAHGGIATGDPGVSPDRTHTGRPPRTCRSYVIWSSIPQAPEQSRRTTAKQKGAGSAMTESDVLFGYRLRLVALAAERGVSEACRLMGVHRSTYYRWRAQVERSGLEMLRPRERRRPRMPNQFSLVVEQRIVAFSLGHPGLGPKRIAARLARPQWAG
jgi:hypothetical protein